MLRRLNMAKVLDAVHQASPVPQRVAELMSTTGLARPTVSQAVDELTALGWLVDHPAVTHTGAGRPAARVGLNGRAAPVLGIDVGPHRISAGVVDIAGLELARAQRRLQESTAAHVIDVMEGVVGEVLSAAAVPADHVAETVVGTPGIIDPETGSISYAPSIPGWTSINLKEHLSRIVGSPIEVENDANLAALGVTDEIDDSGTVLAIQWGERLGAGLIINGRLHRGAGAAGEIGFIRPAGRPGKAGGRGPLEAAVGAEAIKARAAQMRGGDTGGETDWAQDVSAVFRSAAGGYEPALALVDELAAELCEAIAPALLLLCPDTVILSGGVARAGQVLLDAMRRELEELTLVTPRVEFSDLAERSTLNGAYRLGLDAVWDRAMHAMR